MAINRNRKPGVLKSILKAKKPTRSGNSWPADALKSILKALVLYHRPKQKTRREIVKKNFSQSAAGGARYG